MQKKLEAAKKLIRIIEAEVHLLKEETPERQLNKKIAQRTRLRTEYVSKARRAAYKDKPAGR